MEQWNKREKTPVFPCKSMTCRVPSRRNIAEHAEQAFSIIVLGCIIIIICILIHRNYHKRNRWQIAGNKKARRSGLRGMGRVT